MEILSALAILSIFLIESASLVFVICMTSVTSVKGFYGVPPNQYTDNDFKTEIQKGKLRGRNTLLNSKMRRSNKSSIKVIRLSM